MSMLSNSLETLSHHAYLLVGGETIHADLVSILDTKFKLHVRGNPDFFDQSFENFTIDDARELKANHNTRPAGDSGKKVFVLTMNGITVEAQNALLKLLEEPAEYALFFLLVPSLHIILPTVRSRLAIINLHDSSNVGDSEVSAEAKAFLKLSQPERLEFVKSLVDDISKEKKTKQDAIDFLNAIEGVIYRELGVKNGNKQLEIIGNTKKYLTDRAPSIKMLLEYVSLSI